MFRRTNDLINELKKKDDECNSYIKIIERLKKDKKEIEGKLIEVCDNAAEMKFIMNKIFKIAEKPKCNMQDLINMRVKVKELASNYHNEN